jgi:sugar phosphate isomerase/epimerase
MIHLSALADEISPDLDAQLAVLRAEGIQHLELRGAWGTNVLDLSDAQVAEIGRAIAAAGLRVSAVAAPIGKVPIDGPAADEGPRLARAIAVAQALGTARIRIFSFYPAAGEESPPPRDAVLARLRALTAQAAAAGVMLLHENEKDIYGDSIARCVDLLQSVDDPHFRALLDPANFLQCGQRPYPDAYVALRPWLAYVHVKDVDRDGTLVVAGAGEADWPALLARLRADGYDGFLSLEPHLEAAGQFQGFSGPDRFRQASQALQRLLKDMGWEYA